MAKGRAVKVYVVTDKARRALEDLGAELSEKFPKRKETGKRASGKRERRR